MVFTRPEGYRLLCRHVCCKAFRKVTRCEFAGDWSFPIQVLTIREDRSDLTDGHASMQLPGAIFKRGAATPAKQSCDAKYQYQTG